MDDVEFHPRNALIDHSYSFSGGRRDIDRASADVRTTVVNSNDDRTAVGGVCDAQPRAEWQRRMRSSQFVGVEFFSTRSLRVLPVETGKRVRPTLSLGRPCQWSEMLVQVSDACRLLPIASLQCHLIRYKRGLAASRNA
jgi:hypothetical protein